MNKPLSLLTLAIAASLLMACSEQAPPPPEAPEAPETAEAEAPEGTEMETEASSESESTGDNPLLTENDLPYGMPPFDKIESEHFQPAFEAAMEEHMAEVEEIANSDEEPTFENTILAMERAGLTLQYIGRVFSNLNGTVTDDTLQETQRKLAPKFSAHSDAINLNPELFERIEAVYNQRDELDLSPEGLRLVEEYHKDFVRAGAQLNDEEKEELKKMNSELAELTTQFSQNVLKEVNDSAVVFDSREALAGLSDSRIEAAADEAADRDLEEGKYVITLVNTSIQPPIAEMENRDSREKVKKASLARGARGNEYDNTGVVADIVRLRAERAQLLGYDTHADYVLEDRTAQTVEAVNGMLGELAPIAVANARLEGEDIQEMINESEEEPFELKSWDWFYYAEQVRQDRYAFDEDQIKPYFEMNTVLEDGVFYSAEKLFGITFEKRPDLPTQHQTATAWEAFEADGTSLGIVIMDFYARGTKRGGAWMNSYRLNSELLGGHPVLGMHLNVPKPPEGEPTLLTWDETTTMFHEFGHVVHGLFSDVEYPTFAGTSVPRDFVEYPSQVYEIWAAWPEVLANYAKHYETGEQIPQELLDKVIEAQKFNEGFATTEYLAAAIIDQAFHQLGPDETPAADAVMDFEASVLEEHGLDYEPVPPRYRTPYFSHSMGGYDAGYYSYIWSEVLDADSALWIKENGGLDRETGQHYRDTILSKGGSKAAMDLYLDFAGREPSIEPLLERRGLVIDDEG
ncbi:M3 family metallopeptidase [Wenzhouxiangella sp. EGI_FJ10305]|uniref:M3 family metallopeptidase n=1 Tax=Wenzhouxiangella sp. EGI_FJ10305 TaxID=3243768 RepID=UPI0035E3314F